MPRDSQDRDRWICAPPGAPQSLSPFESHTTTMVVLWSTMAIAMAVLVVCWTFWL